MLDKRLVWLVLGLVLVLAGCKDSPKTGPTGQKETMGTTATPPAASAAPTPSPSGKIANMEDVKSKLQLGMNEEQVKAVFGDKYDRVVNAMSGDPSWRYDFGKEGYRFKPQKGLEGTDTAHPDTDGLRKGDVNVQLFIDWSPEKTIRNYAIYAADPQGNITEFHAVPENKAQAGGPVNLEYVKQNLKLGLTKEQVLKLFGNQYAEVTNAMTDSKMWRYNIAKGSYKPKQDDLDAVDTDALKSGELSLQLFIDWTKDNKVGTYTVYTKKSDGKVYEYRLSPDGTASETAL